MTRVLFTGDRGWHDTYIVDLVIGGLESLLNGFPTEELVVIEGEANGLDRIARAMAQARHRVTSVLPYPAHWRHTKDCPRDCQRSTGRAAGPIRNQMMLDEGKPQMVFAFHNNLRKSKGTLNMIEQALKRDIPVFHIRSMNLETCKEIRRWQRKRGI